MIIETILKEHEDQRREFKENAKSPDRILETACAFANTSGGDIVIGIRDKTRDIIGVDNVSNMETMLSNKIYHSIKPKVLPEISITSYSGKHLILVKIHPSSQKPHHINKKGRQCVYVRCGSTNQLADNDILESIKRSINVSYDSEAFNESKLEDFDLESVAQILNQATSYQKGVDVNACMSLGLLTKLNGIVVPTIGGIILFGKNRLNYFPQAQIRIVVFAGDKKNDPNIYDKCIKSPLPYAISTTLMAIRDHITIELQASGLYHKKIWEIPEVAIREAIVNAVVHNDYCLRDLIRVMVFNDRIEIENNSIFLGGLILERPEDSVSRVHNHVIARFFKEIGFIEEYGSGITKMLEACKNAGIKKPLFKIEAQRLKVTLFKKDRDSTPVIDDADEFIISLIALCGSLSTLQVAYGIGKSRRLALMRLGNLVSKGILVEIGSSPNDPKRVYGIKENSLERTKRISKMIIGMQWDHENSLPSLKIYIALGRGRICIVLEYEDIDNFFVDGGSGSTEKREKDVKNVLLSSPPELGCAIVNALADEKIQKILKQKQTPKILLIADNRNGSIYPRRFSGADAHAAFPITSRIGFRKH